MNPGSQSDVESFLSDPATHGGVAPERVDTHISTLFLANDRVWKLKKAVTLPFLDFSTVEARRQACMAEQAVNSRTAPAMYLGAFPVTRTADGHLAIDGDGEAVDWLVAMRRFDEQSLATNRIKAGSLDRQAIHALTEAVWDLHRTAQRKPAHGGQAGLARTIGSNDACFQGLTAILPRDKTLLLTEQTRSWLDRLAPLLERRRQAGFVRHCHGDLHCGNICLFDGKPTLFDAIEFSDDFAFIDVFYDLAFLLMDLHRKGGRVLASYALNHYLDLSGDYGAVPLLPLLLSLRAAIRAHVAATIAVNSGRQAQAGEARDYLDAALAYLSPPPPRLLAVGGLSGSGKSRMGRELAPFLGVPGAVVVRSDALRKQILGVGLLDRPGPAAYTPEMTERTYQALYDTCECLLRSGHAVVADAVFAKPEQRDAIRAIARQAGVPFDGLWLEASPEVTVQRIKNRKANVSDATPEVFERQLEYDLGAIDWVRVDTSGTREEALETGRKAIKAD